MGFLQSLAEHLQISVVSPGHDDEIAVLVRRDLVKAVIEIAADDDLGRLREPIAIGVLRPVIDDICLKIHVAEHRIQGLGHMAPAEDIGAALCLELLHEVSGIRGADIVDLHGGISAAAHGQGAGFVLPLLIQNELIGQGPFFFLQQLPAEFYCLRFQESSAHGADRLTVLAHEHDRAAVPGGRPPGADDARRHIIDSLFNVLAGDIRNRFSHWFLPFANVYDPQLIE